MSHPSRVRGLKPDATDAAPDATESHPSRVRGLKHFALHDKTCFCYVAPFTGAWIETKFKRDCIRDLRVAPFTGAWIETY